MTDTATDAAPPVRPTSEELSEGIRLLLAEVDGAFSSSRWALLDSGTERAQWLAYDGAALRHCCQLLREIEAAAQGGYELTARILGRAHLEAWLVSLYIHFGGYPAIQRLTQEARRNLEALDNDAKGFDRWLMQAKKDARQSGRKVEQTNAGIAMWNAAHPAQPAKSLLEAPYVPRLNPTDLDLADVLASFGRHESQGLPISDIVNALSEWGPEHGFGRESFRPMYIIFRVLSTIGAHTSKPLLDAYLEPYNPRAAFIKIASAPNNGSAIDLVRINTLHSTPLPLPQPTSWVRSVATPLWPSSSGPGSNPIRQAAPPGPRATD